MSVNQSCAIVVCIRQAKQEKTTASTARGIYDMKERDFKVCERCNLKKVASNPTSIFSSRPLTEIDRLSFSHCWSCAAIVTFERRKFVPKPYKELWRPLKE